MEEFGNEEIAKVEKVLLKGGNFNEEQLEFINLMRSSNISACPGSGKTTSLVAKVILLMKKLKNEEKSGGVCVITHTNVAVNEINSALTKLGMASITYPHFIGTIHEFFNYYISINAYVNYTSNPSSKVIFLDDDYYDLFAKEFLRIHSWWDFNPPTSIIKNSKLIINSNSESPLELVPTKEDPEFLEKFTRNYNRVLEVVEHLYNNGFLRHSDTFSLAEWYLESFEDDITDALNNRFDYVLIDEVQDTDAMAIQLLNRCFHNSDTIFQKIGDPYQSIYFFEDELDNNDIFEDSREILTLPNSNRFGNSIASLLNNVIDNNIIGNDEVNSLDPILILFSNEVSQDILNVYSEIINFYDYNNAEFKGISKEDYLVCQHKNQIIAHYYNEMITQKNLPKVEGVGTTCYKMSLKWINKLLTYKLNTRALEELLKTNSTYEWEDYKINLASFISDVLTGNEDNEEIRLAIEAVINDLQNFVLLKEMNEEEKSSFINSFIVNLTSIIKQFSSNNNESINTFNHEDLGTRVRIGTIHSVKGETHRSTLLVESFNRWGRDLPEKDPQITPVVKSIISNPEVAVEDATNQISYIEKQIYVALSRPTHLAALALPVEEFNTNDIEVLENMGWRVLNLNEFSSYESFGYSCNDWISEKLGS
ncbi:UvrD-helicase domain-containing protein [Halobacillus sp. Marseille-P3879]|uniref:UvrD-helicase domain-containing protein n=1 Tax=Halobacillus sp. Marseille-P3879 TaxID=2045014 RepID=UPI000C7E508F|nr:UvrD-helicase domain-containing protein [Halobacillus sp. Marseille-P3879]